MFTGIVEEIGRIEAVDESSGGRTLEVAARRALEGTRAGDSLALDGVCLTVTGRDEDRFRVDLAPETLRRTTLGGLAVGDEINLERSLAANGRFGGHFVQGHVDGTGLVRRRFADGDALWIAIEAPPVLLRYVVPKGYIAVDGISLTVVDVQSDAFTFMLVPHTRSTVVLPSKSEGRPVNLEVDIVGKYVEKLLGERADAAGDD